MERCSFDKIAKLKRGEQEFEVDEQRVEIVRVEDKRDSYSLSAVIKHSGELLLEGHDIGARARELFGDSDYEYWFTVQPGDKDRLLLRLLREALHIHGINASRRFRELLEEEGIVAEFFSYS